MSEAGDTEPFEGDSETEVFFNNKASGNASRSSIGGAFLQTSRSRSPHVLSATGINTSGSGSPHHSQSTGNTAVNESFGNQQAQHMEDLPL